MSQKQRDSFSKGMVDLVNIIAGALVFGQLVSGQVVDMGKMVLGIMLAGLLPPPRAKGQAGVTPMQTFHPRGAVS
jgi:hypothetical protein